jgi:hypothetical protein
MNKVEKTILVKTKFFTFKIMQNKLLMMKLYPY